jgi:hypothetical protein
MNTRTFAAAASLALAVPFGMAFVVPLLRTSPVSLQLSALSWLYMAAPQLLVVLIASFRQKARSGAVAVLLALTALLLVFQAWVWWRVPARESGLAWVLYYPLAVVAVLVSLAIWFGFRKDVERVS